MSRLSSHLVTPRVTISVAVALVFGMALGVVGGACRDSGAAPPVAPRPVAAPSADGAALCMGAAHACVITREGTLHCAGRNLDGQLGDGTSYDHRRPTMAIGLRGVTRVSCGEAHTCAIAGGALHCWGRNDRGQLGLGSRESTATPALVTGLADVVDVALGASSTCAVRATGAVVCFGAADEGRLGRATTDDALGPVAVPGVRDAAAVAMGIGHACVLGRDGGVRCWGEGRRGQLGGRDAASRATATRVPGLTAVQAIAAGGETTCALVAHGLVCFGGGEHGELGNGQSGRDVGNTAPTRIDGLDGVMGVVMGRSHVCARLGDGTAKCWGDGFAGQLGSGLAQRFAEPVAVRGLASARAIANGDTASCALRRVDASGVDTLACWGSNGTGLFGDGTTSPHMTAVDTIADVDRAELDAPLLAPPDAPTLLAETPETTGTSEPAIAVGDAHLCALRADRSVVCTGAADFGRLGHGSASLRAGRTAAAVVGINDAVALATEGATTCVVRRSGRAACWGRGDVSLGHAGIQTSSRPIEVDDIVDAHSIDVGRSFVCIGRSTGAVACFGENGHGQLGNGGTLPSATPGLVLGVDDAISVAAGRSFACALRANGSVSCWGDGTHGQLGNDALRASSAPVAVLGLRDAVAIAASADDACALRRNGSVVCWGETAAGLFGPHADLGSRPAPGHPYASRPVPAAGVARASRIAVGDGFACALAPLSGLRCWGANSYGQLGRDPSETTIAATPVEVPSDRATEALGLRTTLALGPTLACAGHASGVVECWGSGPVMERAAELPGDRRGSFEPRRIAAEWLGASSGVPSAATAPTSPPR